MKLKERLTKKENIEEWLIKNLIGMGEIAIMYAPPDHHKTGMALKIAMEVITGGMDMGKSQTGKVLFYNLDTPVLKMDTRAKALMENSYLDHLDQIGLNLDIREHDINLTDNHWAKRDSLVITWKDLGIHHRNDGFKLIIIDTLSKVLVGAGVNDDAIIRKVIFNLREIIRGAKNKLSILLIHHSGKDARKGMMGSSILLNDVSTVLRIKKKKDAFELYREKHKSAFKGKAIPFKFRSVLTRYQDNQYDSLYIDIGSTLDELSAEIVSQFNEGLSKKKIKENTLLLGLGNTTTDKSFGVVFNRRWKTLIDTGFISEKETGNKTTD